MLGWPFKPTTLFTLTLLIGGVGSPFIGLAASLTVEAEHDLGVQYLKGEGVSLDKVRGRTYIQQSARRDYPLAQFHLGLLFYRGEAGDKSLSCAEYWFKQNWQNNIH